MTIEDKLKEMLIDHGLWEDQALIVLETVKADEFNEAMAGHWQNDIEGYPPQLMAVLWKSAKRSALEYIDANCPKAWFRPMFTDTKEG